MLQKKNNGQKIRSIQKQESNRIAYRNMEFPKDEDGVIYVRQSSIAQLQKNIHSFEMQTEKFLEYFRNRGCTGYIEIISDDEGMSGTKDIHEMPGLSRVMRLIEGEELLRGKQIGWAAAVHVNRFTRDKWLVKPGTIMKACYDNDIWLATLRMDFNFQDDYCQRVFMIEAEESARHLEWMKLVLGGGKSAASDNGHYDGRWLVPGYIVDRSDEKRKKYIIYEPHAKVVRWLFRRYLELDGNFIALCREVDSMPFLFPRFEEWVGWKNISKFSGTGSRKKCGSLIKEGPYKGNYKPSAHGIRSILCNPVYIGWWIPINGGLVENNHNAIVDEVLFTYAHKRLSSHDLNGVRQKPKNYQRSGKAEAILKKVLYDERDMPMYATYNKNQAGEKSLYYRSNSKNRLIQDFRYAVSVAQLDASVLKKFFERISVLEELDDWEDKLAERLATKEASQEYNKKLIRKQIKDAQARWKEMFDTLNDPEITKTKQMKIEYANQMAGLEEKIAGWESELEAPDDEDEEITLYEIRSLLPDIASAWKELSLRNRLRFVGALIRKIVVNKVTPSWIKVEIHWKSIVGDFIDVGYFRRWYTNRTEWSDEEKDVVRRLYPTEDAQEILNILPDRSWKSIAHCAQRLDVRRERGRRPNSIHVTEKGNDGTIEDRKFEEEHGLDPTVKSIQWFW